MVVVFFFKSNNFNFFFEYLIVLIITMPQTIELCYDRAMLPKSFPGYKLSTDEVRSSTLLLTNHPDRIDAEENAISFLHAKLFDLHNHLTGEMFEGGEAVYFFDSDWNLQKIPFDEEMVAIWKLPRARTRKHGDYNISMKLISKERALVSDGIGTFYILQREGRWTEEFSGEITGPDEYFIILDGAIKDETEIHVLLLSLRYVKSHQKFCSIIHWMTLEKTDSWNQVALRELTVPGHVQYASLEESCTAIHVISDEGCKFTLDSEHEIRPTTPPPEKPLYVWFQSSEQVFVEIPHKDVLEDLVQITTEDTKIMVKFGDEVKLEGDFYLKIEPNLTQWSFEPDSVQIVLKKSEEGVTWPELVPNDKTGKWDIGRDQTLAEIVKDIEPYTSETEENLPSGSTLDAQEECDLDLDKCTFFERIERDSHEKTHRSNLGLCPILLTTILPGESRLSFGTRLDVDVCLWQPKMENEEFTLQHRGTLFALGYIQASKQHMKYFVCSPDLSYSAICESTHVFIYCQKRQINELRNRTTGQIIKSLAQQLVYRLPVGIEVLGLYASNKKLYILGQNFITALRI